jgi:dipeptidyl aminopeptidase/acylaminoacyl peptidase
MMLAMSIRVVWLAALAVGGGLVLAKTGGVAAGQPAAQAPPATEIYLAPFVDGDKKTTRIAIISIQREGVSIGKPVVNITNSPGYDNQPFFLPDSSGLLFSSNRDGKQTDIYRYDIASKTVSQLTRTPENEYSPTVLPDGKTFSTVRGPEQRLWKFGLDGSDAGLALAHKGLIGYHAWISPTEVAAFILGGQGAPNTLELVDLPTGKSDVIISSIGRSLLMRPGGKTLSFVHKPQDGAWEIKELDPATRKIDELAPTVEGSEDLAWSPRGRLVMGSKNKLFLWADDHWLEIANLGDLGIAAITRLAISPDGKWIAIVSTPAK